MDKLAIVEKYLSILKDETIDISVLADMLAEDAVLMSTSGNAEGRDAVIRRMREPGGRLFRESTWSEPAMHGDAVKVTGVGQGLGSGGTILVFHFRDDKISLLQHQFYTVRVAGTGTPIQMSQELKDIVNNSLAQRHPIVVGYVDERGAPVLSFRGSVQAFSDTVLAIWIRPESRMAEAIKNNPQVALLYRNEDTHEDFQFQGRARIATDEEEMRRVYENSPAIERERDMAQLGVAVIIGLDLVEGNFVRIRRESERVRMERNEA